MSQFNNGYVTGIYTDDELEEVFSKRGAINFSAFTGLGRYSLEDNRLFTIVGKVILRKGVVEEGTGRLRGVGLIWNGI